MSRLWNPPPTFCGRSPLGLFTVSWRSLLVTGRLPGVAAGRLPWRLTRRAVVPTAGAGAEPTYLCL